MGTLYKEHMSAWKKIQMIKEKKSQQSRDDVRVENNITIKLEAYSK